MSTIDPPIGSTAPNPRDPDLASLAETLAKTLEVQQSQLQALRHVARQLDEQQRMLEVLGKAQLASTLDEVDELIQERQYSMSETMELVADGKSLARWGDGEIRLMLQPEFELSFQKPDRELATALRRVLLDYDINSDHLLLAFPTVFVSRLWMGIWAESWRSLKPILQQSTSTWANTHVSRPLFFQKHREQAVLSWRAVWENKKICIIAGKGSRFELLPELFDNARSIDRVDAPPRDAFSSMDEIVRSIQMKPRPDLYLIALGPTGTVLAAYLSSKAGGSNHAVDIGHLSTSYATAFLGGRFPEAVPLLK